MSRKNNKMSQLDLAWAAGVFDGEGCVRILKTTRKGGLIIYVLMVDVTQSGVTTPLVSRRYVELFGGRASRRDDFRPGHERITRWSWRIVAAEAERFLRLIQPYSIGKRKQIDLALEYREKAVGQEGRRANKVLQEQYYQRISAMKVYVRRKDIK